MNNSQPNTLSSLSFPEAIEATQSIMSQIRSGQINEAEIETKITSLVSSKQGARGFFVAYLTSDLSLADNPSVGIINGLKSAPDLVGELLVKNVAMSTAMAITHRRNQDEATAKSSDRVADRSINLIKKLDLDSIAAELTKLQTTLTQGKGSYQQFLEQWGYDAEQKDMIEKKIAQINN
ncbi:MAG: hypothetical protein AB4368_21310 [Xenococcaceae cyanobacterium]